MKNLTLVTMCLASLMAFAGCGDDGGGSSGLSNSTAASDLTVDEVQALCEELADRGTKTFTCGTETVEIAIDPADCATAEAFPATCEATVGDFRDCLDAIFALTDAEFCESGAEPAACEAVFAEACSGF